MIRGQEKKIPITNVSIFPCSQPFFFVKLETLACFLNMLGDVLLKQLEAQDGRAHLFSIAKQVQDVQDNTSKTRGVLENHSQLTLAPRVYEAKTK